MNKTDAQQTWEIAALLLDDVESTYRVQRLRPGGAQPLDEEAEKQLVATILRVSEVYRAGDEALRQRIHSFFERAHGLWPYAVQAGSQAAAEFIQTSSVERLEIALIAWAISHDDPRDTLHRLDWLYREATGLGCPADATFAKIGQLSFGYMRTMLSTRTFAYPP